LVQQEQGVTLTTTALAGRVVFCFVAADGWKIAAGYGIELSVPEPEKGYWSEPLPKLLATEYDYFPGPVTMDLQRQHARAAIVIANLGACFKTELCTPIRLVVRVPATSQEERAVIFCSNPQAP
jgi:hypothetical protein